MLLSRAITLNYAHIYLATIMLKIICRHNPPEGANSITSSCTLPSDEKLMLIEHLKEGIPMRYQCTNSLSNGSISKDKHVYNWVHMLTNIPCVYSTCYRRVHNMKILYRSLSIYIHT